MTGANPQLVSFQGVFGNLSIRAVFPISSASSHAFAPTLKETTTCLPTSTCTPPFPVVSARVSTLPSFSSHDHLSMSASASLFQAVHSHASTLPVSSSRVIDHSPTFTPSSAFPSPVFTPPSSRVLGVLGVLVFHVPLRVILPYILMLTPSQYTSTLLVQCTLTPHKPWIWLPPLITPLCCTILALVLKLILLSLKIHVMFHLLFSQ